MLCICPLLVTVFTLNGSLTTLSFIRSVTVTRTFRVCTHCLSNLLQTGPACSKLDINSVTKVMVVIGSTRANALDTLIVNRTDATGAPMDVVSAFATMYIVNIAIVLDGRLLN